MHKKSYIIFVYNLWMLFCCIITVSPLVQFICNNDAVMDNSQIITNIEGNSFDNNAIIYVCGPKTRDYVDTPPSGLPLVPIIVVIVIILWAVTNIYAKFEEARNKRKEYLKKQDETYRLSHNNYSVLGSPIYGIQLVRIAESRYSYVKEDGSPLNNVIYEEAESFKNGSAIVKKENQLGLLNIDGTYLFNLGKCSQIVPIGNCLLVKFNYGSSTCQYFYDRKGVKLSKRVVDSVTIDEDNNYVLILDYDQVIKDVDSKYLYTERSKYKESVTINEKGEIIKFRHNIGEEYTPIYNDIALYHAGGNCGLINVETNEVLVDADQYRFTKIIFYPRTKLFIAKFYVMGASIVNPAPHIKESWNYIFDENARFLGKILDCFNNEPFEPLTRNLFLCGDIELGKGKVTRLFDIDGHYCGITFESIIGISDSHRRVLGVNNVNDDQKRTYYLQDINDKRIIRTFYNECIYINDEIEEPNSEKSIRYIVCKERNGLLGMIDLDGYIFLPPAYNKIIEKRDTISDALVGFMCYHIDFGWEAYNAQGVRCSKNIFEKATSCKEIGCFDDY